ncbi:polyadenylate-binding protein 2 isoform X1 [Panicum miliaceum]|uniref:Polyadenylate-binding protein 2 isoform X1 n=1 Tax=Panicum miliaceum TaxID=4540 RepID=A0A3L6RZZ9_PANMI|nr:polyadenylate-binding protein 2 isoform X1 [Panicum miliaceum]
MEDEEHEVYGQEIPVDGEDVDMSGAGGDDAKVPLRTPSTPPPPLPRRPNPSGGTDPFSRAQLQELDEMKRRLKEMEEEAAALREMQAKVAKEMQGVDPNATTSENKEEMDARSVFVGNVDYACTPEEVQQHFNSCGTVNRVTILTDKFGQPKGFAYVEFVEVEAVQEAVKLNESELHGRQLKVAPKRTNVPGMKQPRGRGFNPYHGHPYMRPYGYSPYGYGRFPRFRRPRRPYF